MDHTQSIVEILHTVSPKRTVPSIDESLFDSGYLDSFALPDMVCALERRFQIRIPDSDLNPRSFESIARIGQYIDRAASATKR